MTVKERFLSEDHAGEHATQTPHVQAVVIHLQKRKRLEGTWGENSSHFFNNTIKHHFDQLVKSWHDLTCRVRI